MTINQRLGALREAMQSAGIDAYIIPSSDPHQSEYVAEYWKAREWISGFTGSAGTCAVTHGHAGLWTDSRYFLQAEEQLSVSDFELHKLGVQGASEHVGWLAEHLDRGGKVGCDPWVISLAEWRRMEKEFSKKGIELVATEDLVGAIRTDLPGLPAEEVFEQLVEYAGESRAEKLGRIRSSMHQEGATLHLLSTLDDIAWTMNVRGSDVQCNPVAISYAVVGKEKAWLFIDEHKPTETLKQSLTEDGVELKSYDEIHSFLESLSVDETILIDPATTSKALFDAIQSAPVAEGSTIPIGLKAIKNTVEVEGIRRAMVKDGVALTRFFRWFESTLAERGIPETEVAEQLAHFRSEQEGYYGESFDAIVGYKGNGAIVHYRAMPETCATIQPEGILLIDSGGQYRDGTTDITRTVALSEPDPASKKHFTLVLKGHIALSECVFPEGTRGIQLDILARQFLWNEHLNYGHGTGHGVGVFLNVHEPPQGFAPTLTSRGTTPFSAGMFSSNEPGFYKEGSYGIRIENLILTVEAGQDADGVQWLRFENLTWFPIDKALIDKTLLTESECQWLNAYHKTVYELLSPQLNREECEWLAEKCAPV
jgi:Xaa-Pro aminopeptidase